MQESQPPPLPTRARTPRIRRLRFFTRFRFSGVLLALLLFVWFVGVWEGYHQQRKEGFDEGIQATALQVIDRELRLADAGAGQPAWLRWALSCDDRTNVLGAAQESLIALDEAAQLDRNGKTALEVISRQLDQSGDHTQEISPLDKIVLDNQKLSHEQINLLEIRLNKPSATWWDAEVAKIAEKQYGIDDFNDELAAQQLVNHQLFNRALWGQALSYGAFILGLCLLPSGVRTLRKQWPVNTAARPIRYHQQWARILLVSLFFLSQVASDWAIAYVYRVTAWLDKGFAFDVVVDSFWRLLPPLLVLFVIFGKPRLIIRSLGLIKKPLWSLIFAVYALLVLINPFLEFLLDKFIDSDPSGGLDRMENGWQGLCYGLISGCIIAPIAEELAFRGLLFNALLRRSGFLMAAGLTSVIFALAHYYDLYGTVSVGLFGFACAFVYRATGSLINTIILHAIYNFTITLPIWLIYHYGA